MAFWQCRRGGDCDGRDGDDGGNGVDNGGDDDHNSRE